jgi:hypothetical protein
MFNTTATRAYPKPKCAPANKATGAESPFPGASIDEKTPSSIESYEKIHTIISISYVMTAYSVVQRIDVAVSDEKVTVVAPILNSCRWEYRDSGFRTI